MMRAKPITDYLPEDKVKALPEEQKERFDKLSVRRFLTMSIDGFPFRSEGDNWLDHALSCEIDPEKILFNYSNITVYVVCVALTNILGRDLGGEPGENQRRSFGSAR